jgi:hypothetical protein
MSSAAPEYWKCKFELLNSLGQQSTLKEVGRGVEQENPPYLPHIQGEIFPREELKLKGVWPGEEQTEVNPR